MLKKSFKGGKCKTSLKLAVARIKLLKNKREVQLRQMKRDLAQLLETGQEQTARIRVEHVVREEKTMAAYDLIEIYCELIVARLPIIESQKTCPIDLKEAITSVVFASPRCTDLPELLDVRKHFTSKYGKEFIASALELRPDCGVGRQMVEKLSVRALDGETNIKILTAIAKEHNVKWDRKDFEEKELTPPEDLLNGPTTFGTTTKMAMEPPSVQHQPQPQPQPQAQAQPTHSQKHDSSINISQNRSSLNSQDYASVDTTSSMAKPATFHPQSMASESGNGGREFRDSYFREGNAFPASRQNWNMEFKDATAAAQAAAESAERASIAARAAAELSSGGKNVRRQYSSEFHESFDYSVRDERPGQHVNQDPVKMTYDSRTSSSHSMERRTQNQDRDRNGTDNLGGDPRSTYDGSNRRLSQSVSPGFTMASNDDERPAPNLQKADRYIQKSSLEVESTNINRESRNTEKGHFHDEVSIKNQSSDSEVDYVDQQPHSKTSEYIGFPFEGKVRQNSSKSTFSSHASADGDDTTLNSDIHNYGNVGEHSFKNTGTGNTQSDTKQPSFNDYPGAVFDDCSFDDDINLGAESGYNGHESDHYAPSPVRKSDSRSSQTIDSWTPRQHRNESMKDHFDLQSNSNDEPHSPPGFPERLSKATVHSKLDDLLPAAFDDSDGVSSEIDVEIDNYQHSGRTETTTLPHKQNVFTRTLESAEIDWDHGSTRSSFSKKANAEAYMKPSVHSSFDNPESEDGGTKRTRATTLNFEGESAKTYSGYRSTKSSLVEKEAAGTNRKPWLPSSSDDSESEGILEDQGKQRDFGGESRKEYGHGILPGVEAVPGHISSPRNMDRKRAQGNEKKQPLQTSGVSESGQGLNLGRLVGGLRNKGNTRRTYTKDRYADASPQSTQQSTENTPTFNEQPNDFPKFKSSTTSQTRDSELHNQKPQKVPKEFSSRSPKSYFDSDSDDDDPLPPQTVRSKGYTSGRLNNPRESPAEADTSSLSTFMGGYTEQVTPLGGITKKASTQISQGQGEDSKWPKSDSSVEPETRNPVSLPEVSIRNGISRSRVLKTDPSVEHWPSKPIPEPVTVASSSTKTPSKTVSSENTKTSKPSISSEGSNSLKKAGHVHPKLPDYDTFAAHFESLRSNRQSS